MLSSVDRVFRLDFGEGRRAGRRVLKHRAKALRHGHHAAGVGRRVVRGSLPEASLLRRRRVLLNRRLRRRGARTTIITTNSRCCSINRAVTHRLRLLQPNGRLLRDRISSKLIPDRKRAQLPIRLALHQRVRASKVPRHFHHRVHRDLVVPVHRPHRQPRRVGSFRNHALPCLTQLHILRLKLRRVVHKLTSGRLPQRHHIRTFLLHFFHRRHRLLPHRRHRRRRRRTGFLRRFLRNKSRNLPRSHALHCLSITIIHCAITSRSLLTSTSTKTGSGFRDSCVVFFVLDIANVKVAHLLRVGHQARGVRVDFGHLHGKLLPAFRQHDGANELCFRLRHVPRLELARVL
mmetsp:Transcript_7704/g.16461  ORF Transcript_7704/g.16461 Transcript_7704/m.16461 type:complete len:347 (-) Transcript_7704:1625-2665(-)